MFLFDLRLIRYFDDALVDELFCGTVSRSIMSIMFIFIMYLFFGKKALLISNGGFKGLLWAIPCILVALANFPFSALIMHTAEIIRFDVLWLYILFVLTTGVFEEVVFRGLFLTSLESFFRNKNHKNLLIIVISATVFSLLHCLNFGTTFGLYTLLQIGYTFLIGCMLGTLYIYTKNIWICVGIHALFNFGGLIIDKLGSGNPWDLVFWIVTAVCGVFCAIHVIFTVIELDKKYYAA